MANTGSRATSPPPRYLAAAPHRRGIEQLPWEPRRTAHLANRAPNSPFENVFAHGLPRGGKVAPLRWLHRLTNATDADNRSAQSAGLGDSARPQRTLPVSIQARRTGPNVALLTPTCRRDLGHEVGWVGDDRVTAPVPDPTILSTTPHRDCPHDAAHAGAPVTSPS